MPPRQQGGGMERMISMLATLSQIQNQKRQMKLQEDQLKQQNEQFVASLGFNKGQEQWKKILDLLKLGTDASLEQKDAYDAIIDAANFEPGEAKAMKLFSRNAPESLETLKKVAAGQGYRNPQASPFQREVASTQMTGQTQGGLGVSGLQGDLVRSARSQLTPFMGQEFAQRAAGGNSVMDAGVGRQFSLNPDLMRKLAAVTAGTDMTMAQSGNLDVARQNAATAAEGNEIALAGINRQARGDEMAIAAQLAAKMQAGGPGGVTPDDINRTMSTLTEKSKIMMDPKANDALRLKAQQEYDLLVTIMGMPELRWDPKDPGGSVGKLTQLWRKVSPAGPQQVPPGAGVVQPNTLMPFINPSRP